MSVENEKSGENEDTTFSGCTVRVGLTISSQYLEGEVRRALYKSSLTETDERTILRLVAGFVKTLTELGFEHTLASGGQFEWDNERPETHTG